MATLTTQNHEKHAAVPEKEGKYLTFVLANVAVGTHHRTP